MFKMKASTSILEERPSSGTNFVFLGGIHGVGKTTICNKLFIPKGYHCVSASDLIRIRRSSIDRNKRVSDIPGNQELLLKQLNYEKAQNRLLLLDGHYTLINSKEEIKPLDPDLFKEMAPSALFLLKKDPKKILKQLKMRDGKVWDLAFIDQFQTVEERHAIHISETLNIPLQIISSGN